MATFATIGQSLCLLLFLSYLEVHLHVFPFGMSYIPAACPDIDLTSGILWSSSPFTSSGVFDFFTSDFS